MDGILLQEKLNFLRSQENFQNHIDMQPTET